MKIDSFWVAGIEARTTNAAEMSGQGIIPALWARFVPTASQIVVVYSGYESDEHEAYNYLIGAKVDRESEVPAGMVLREVAAGDYRMFTSERGPAYEVVPAVWKRIWSECGDRMFQTDFEIYDTRPENPADASVDVFVGIK